MTNEQLYEVLGEINEEYIRAARTPSKRRYVRIRWGMAAACLCLIIGTATVFAATEFGTRIIQMVTAETVGSVELEQSGYQIGIEIEKVPLKRLSKELRQQAKETILRQYAEHNVYDSDFPGCWTKNLFSSQEAREYIGLDSLKKLDWELEERSTWMNVLGDPKGRIGQIWLETDYEVGDIHLQAFSYIYTEFYDSEITSGVWTTEQIEFTEAFHLTENGKQCHVIANTGQASGYFSMDGYLVDRDVLYALHIAYQEQDEEQAKALLHQWADLL